jgi:hypothetical protein
VKPSSLVVTTILSSLLLSLVIDGCGKSDENPPSRTAGTSGTSTSAAPAGGEGGGAPALSAGQGGQTEVSVPSAPGGAGEGGSGGQGAGVGEAGGAGQGGAFEGGAGQAGAGGAAECAVTRIGAVATAKSCAELLAGDASLTDGTYQLDLDGSGPFPSLPFYCDMTQGGWTLVANQVPGSPLPDDQCTVEPTHFGTQDQSYRIGLPVVAEIRPTVAWKLTDATNSVYFKPECVVDWSVNYDTLSPMPELCTTGYTTTAFSAIKNGSWKRASVRGIGINNLGADCSIRIYESHMLTDGTIEASSLDAGLAAPCVYTQYATQRVSLWFR